jgi:predicted nuclease of restriction endonuclease-like (RecB) superfamily
MLINSNEYFEILKDIKEQIKTAQYKAVLGANKELMELYWNIGRVIIANTKYGANFIENLSKDILSEFPDIQGFSVRNLKYMRKFAEIYPDFQKGQRGVALLPWRNNLTLISKIKDEAERQWYIEQNLENGWNNTILTHQIEIKLYQRQAITGKTRRMKNNSSSNFSKLFHKFLRGF